MVDYDVNHQILLIVVICAFETRCRLNSETPNVDLWRSTINRDEFYDAKLHKSTEIDISITYLQLSRLCSAK